MSNVLAVTHEDFNWASFQWSQKRLFDLIEKQRHSDVSLDLSGLRRAFPNGFVPLIVLVEAYRKSHGVKFSVVLPQDEVCRRFLQESNYAAYLCPESGGALSGKTNALHSFSDDLSLNDLINSQIHQALEQATYADGVLQSFEWALNEIAGNVLVHAGVDHGWMQIVIHPKTHHMAIVVADGGVGIPETIRRAYPQYQKDEDAIAHALREGITSRPDFGQGKGLTGTLQIVKINKGGRLSIHSREGRVEWLNDRLDIKGDFPPFPGTLVDIQLDFAEPIEIEKALWGTAPGYPFNESLYGKDMPTGQMKMALIDEATGFGNRLTGLKIRNKIENLLASAPNDVLEIDFSGVELIASSFADEVFGKLALTLGFVGFGSRIRLVSINKLCRGIIDDVVQSRIVQARTSQHGHH
ncbi:MAG: STAS-like domain-containing protein [Burkholderiales bacterium]